MKFYCMCHEKNSKPESQAFGAPNLFAPYDEKTGFRTVVLQRRMDVKKVGIKQLLLFPGLKKVNDWTPEGQINPADIMKQHYPYVDMYECPNCHAKICIE